MKLIYLSALLLINLNCWSQIANLIDPLRKTESAVKSMMTNFTSTSEFYNESGKVVSFTFPGYTMFFSFSRDKCLDVGIYSTKGNIDSKMHEWLYKNGYETSGISSTLWGKMIAVKGVDGKSGTYPVCVQKLNSNDWRVFNPLMSATK